MFSKTSLPVKDRPQKKTAQGCSIHTKLSATPTRARKKRYRGQGKS